MRFGLFCHRKRNLGGTDLMNEKSEIAELMAVRSKFSESGEFQPEWKPPVRCFYGTCGIIESSSRDFLGNRSSSRASSCSRNRCSSSETGLACHQSSTPRKESKNATQGDRCSSEPWWPCRSGSTQARCSCLGAVETYVISSYLVR